MSIWDDAPKNTREVFEYLKVLASRMRVETYGEIAAAISKNEGRRINPRTLNKPLGFIRDRVCRKNSLPWINALAVNAQTRLPGDSFLPKGVAFGDDEKVLWRGTVLSVFGYPWENVTIE